MFLINTQSNTITEMDVKTFSQLGFKEREHLQEWIAALPKALGEDLLIIQKEFDGFDGTFERLDLLALDKSGRLVIIENKLDDTGRDVTWQAIKYAAYCSTLSTSEIVDIYQRYIGSDKNAEEGIKEFLAMGNLELSLNPATSQRIILVAANFRKEVTSSVVWLMSNGLSIQCIKATPYELNGQRFLSLSQIIPVKDVQDYMISMAKKNKEEQNTDTAQTARQQIRLKFWGEFLKAIRGHSNLFQSSNLTKEYGMVAGAGNINGVTFQAIISGTHSTVLLNVGQSSQEANKLMFDTLKNYEEEIHKKFGDKLNWNRGDDMKKSTVSFIHPGHDYFDEAQWPEIIEFLITNINKLEAAVRDYMPKVKAALASANFETLEVSEPIATPDEMLN